MLFYCSRVIRFVRDLFSSRRIIIELAVNDFRSRYIGSYFGILWAFVQPVMTLVILWFVFEAGFKIKQVDEFPFILWLSAGLLPWFFISDGVLSATNSITEHSYLVKQVVFRVSILPIVKIVSSLFVHLCFIAAVLFLFTLSGYSPTVYTLQIIFYLVLTLILMLSISWVTSAVFVFFRDLGQMIAIIMQFGFWFTPVFWSLDRVPDRFHLWLKLNPAFFIVDGYRDSLINEIWFWDKPELTLYFLSVTLLFFLFGSLVFIRLRPHFADVL